MHCCYITAWYALQTDFCNGQETTRRSIPGREVVRSCRKASASGISRTGTFKRSRQQSKHRDAIGCANVDVAIGDQRGDEFVVIEQVAGVGRLVRIIEFSPEVGRIVGKEDSSSASRWAVINGPHDAFCSAVCRDSWRCARIIKLVGGLGPGCCGQ